MDAVIAANAVLTVVYPDQTAIGGDCFFLAWDAATGETAAYNGSGPASRNADPLLLIDLGWTAMPAKGPFAVTIPGTIDAWFTAHERFGRLEMSRLLAPAIALAVMASRSRPGWRAPIAAQTELIFQWPGLQALMMPGGSAPAAGSTIRFPALATSLETIARDGRDAFYTGAIAEQIVATMNDLGGWIDAEDLAGYRGEWVDPVTTTYRGVTIKTTAPNSQGLATLLGLRMAEREDLGTSWGTAAHLHPLVEAARRAYRVRNAAITDPAFVAIDADDWLSDDSIDDLWADYDPMWASASDSHEAGDTVYLCAVDAMAMPSPRSRASLARSIGSRCRKHRDPAPEPRIVLSLNPERVNVLAPGKRTMHTLMASMIFDGDVLRGPIGSQGGDAQALINLQLMTNLIDFGLEPQAAIEAARWLLPSSEERGLLMEEGFPAGAVQQIAARGHEPTVIGGWNGGAGHAQMIMRDPVSGVLMGGADPRADGSAAGY